MGAGQTEVQDSKVRAQDEIQGRMTLKSGFLSRVPAKITGLFRGDQKPSSLS